MVASNAAQLSILASASYDHTIKFWDAVSGNCSQTIAHKESQVNALELTPDSMQLAAAGFQHIRMYDLATGSAVINYEGVSKNVTAVGFETDGRWMFTGGEDCTARVWDMRARQLQCQRIFQVSTSVNTVCLHPNQVELFVGDSSGALYMWDLRTDHNESLHLDSTPASIQHVGIDADGTMLAAITNRGNLYVWNLLSGPVSQQQKLGDGGNEQQQHSADLSPSQAYRGTRFVPKKKLSAHPSYGLKCRFSPDSTILATTSADETAKVWRTADFAEQTVSALKPKSDDRQKWVWDCAFTNDSRYLFTCSSDHNLRLYNLEKGDVARLYSGHQRAVTALAFRDASSR